MARKSSKPRSTNQLRIIGGTHRGRKLSFPDAEGLRPTGDRIRETLFNWLQYRAEGVVVLDAFAGSGALGLEALSRGAREVHFCEANPKVAKQIQENVSILKCDNAVVHSMELSRFLSQSDMKFDLVFLDPPFNKDWLAEVIPVIAQQLSDNAAVYVESEKPFEELPVPPEWALYKEKRTGNVSYGLFLLSRP